MRITDDGGRLQVDGVAGPETEHALAGGSTSTTPAGSAVRDRIVSVACSQIGVAEGTAECNTYVPHGQTCKVGWCAAFAETKTPSCPGPVHTVPGSARPARTAAQPRPHPAGTSSQEGASRLLQLG